MHTLRTGSSVISISQPSSSSKMCIVEVPLLLDAVLEQPVGDNFERFDGRVWHSNTRIFLQETENFGQY